MTESKSGILKKKIFFFGFVFLLLVLFITSIFGKKGLIEIDRTRKTRAALLEDVEKLKKEKSRLEKDIAELEKNPRAVDKDAREQLWLLGPDEKVVVKKKK